MEYNKVAKNFTDTYLYQKAKDIDTLLITAIMNSERLDIDNKEKFDPLKYQIKRRQMSGALTNILNHPSLVLIDTKVVMLPKQFKVFAARDIKKDKNKLKIFVDINRIVYDINGVYETNNIDVLIAYLTSALFNFIYYSNNVFVVNNSRFQEYLTTAFSKLIYNVIDNLYKISLIDGKKEACLYLSSLYCLTNIFKLDIDSDQVKDICKKIANINDRQAEIYYLQINDKFSKDINGFISNLSNLLKLDKLNLDNFVSKWLFLYGTGTLLSLEYLPSLSAMVTDAYVGSYLNNQKTIEKVLGVLLETYTKNFLLAGGGIMRNEKY